MSLTSSSPPAFVPGEEVDSYRRWKKGMRVSDSHAVHFDQLSESNTKWLESVAVQFDERDAEFRTEIARDPHGYGWHKSLGQLPFDWTDNELTRLRPHDWKQARAVRFVRVTSPRTPKRPAAARTRAREHRPAASRRSSSSSATSGPDPGSGDTDEPPAEPCAGRHCDDSRCEAPARWCACGCGRGITHKRPDARTFGASCRQRLKRANERTDCRPLEPRFCQCESGFFYRDAEGDAVCGLCGCWLARLTTRINGFDMFDALLRSNGTHVLYRSIPSAGMTRRRQQGAAG